METPEKIRFKPQARLILQLGDQLIRNESIALLELIKNAYDACAPEVIISMMNPDSKELAEITIEDNGRGMSYTLLRDVWLHPGTTYKKKQVDNPGFKSPCGRIPLGEKGIGRFGVHKLGQEIELVSREKNRPEAYLKLNWSEFDNDMLLEEIPVDLQERVPQVFTGDRHGTLITIRGLRNAWTRGMLRDVYRSVISLNSPFDSVNSFRALFKTNKTEWIKDLLPFDKIKDNALFEAEAQIENNEITSLIYKFTPWPVLTKLSPRTHQEYDIRMSRKVYDEKLRKKVMRDIDLSRFDIGKVTLKLLIFDFDINLLSLGGTDVTGLKEYLKMNGGIRVYRDGVRVYDYGEPGNDWLNLDVDRVNFPTARISNNIVVGALLLDRLQSKRLIEKTNREGFIENDAYYEFLDAVRFTVSRIVTQRNIDKDRLRSHYGKSGEKNPVIGNLLILKQKVENNVPKGDIRNDMLNTIKAIEDDYKTISEIYLRSASAGLSLSIVIHEIDKIIAELIKVVEDTQSSSRVQSLTKHLARLIDGYSGLIRRRSKKESDLKHVIDNALWNIEYRLNSHKVEVIRNYKQEKSFSTMVRCSESLILGSITNIIDNSLWWLNYGQVQNKKVFIGLTNEIRGYITIIIADNGPGFTLPTTEIIKPFISNKEGGMGIGLHLAHEIMNSHGGALFFPSPNDLDVPEEFKTGAIVGLSFKNE